MGQIVPRPKGGGHAILNEWSFCDLSGRIKLSTPFDTTKRASQNLLRRQFGRLFVHGPECKVSGRIDIYGNANPSSLHKFNNVDHIAASIASGTVRLPEAWQQPPCTLLKFPKIFSEVYATKTTLHQAQQCNHKLTFAHGPAIFIEISSRRSRGIALNNFDVIHDTGSARLLRKNLILSGRALPLWVLVKMDGQAKSASRLARMYALRLHSETSSLLKVLQELVLGDKKEIVDRVNFGFYLNYAEKKIREYSIKLERETSPNFAQKIIEYETRQSAQVREALRMAQELIAKRNAEISLDALTRRLTMTNGNVNINLGTQGHVSQAAGNARQAIEMDTKASELLDLLNKLDICLNNFGTELSETERKKISNHINNISLDVKSEAPDKGDMLHNLDKVINIAGKSNLFVQHVNDLVPAIKQAISTFGNML